MKENFQDKKTTLYVRRSHKRNICHIGWSFISVREKPLTKKEDPSLSKEERNKVYYSGIAADPVASMAKIIDRCNNVSTMAQAFSDEKLNEYIEETETYVLPLLKTVKQNYLEYNNAVFLIKYHMLSVLESLKNMMMRN